ncbi:MAG: hypothetical protein WBG57_06645 [Ornithinimicrobium sp.]
MRNLCLACTLALVLTGCSDDSSDPDSANQSRAQEAGEDPGETVVLQRSMEPISIVDTEGLSEVEASAAVSEAFFVSSPAVVIAEASDIEGITQAGETATTAGIPLMLVQGDSATGETADTGDSANETSGDDAAETANGGDPNAATADEIGRLQADTVLAIGPQAEELASSAGDVEIVTSADDLPSMDEVDGLSGVVALVQDDQTSGQTASTVVATANATSAGAEVISLPEPDVRSSPEAIEAVSQTEPDSILAVGADFGSPEQLSSRVDVAKTGVQLPGGGQTLFPGRRLVALYGHPGTAGLGVLGEQDLDESITRAQDMAAEFDPLSDAPAVPTFEIIVTVAQASSGADGDYSSETPVEEMRPWVERAGEEGVYVILDLQPGRANFLDQAKIYEDLLVMPHVGLALDPEWRLTQTQRPLQQIGTVEAEEVNSVIDWLAELTAREKLPQKVLVLHQFRLSMLQDTDEIDTTRDEVAVLIHMDGQGATGDKDSTWQAVVDNAPEGVTFGWKNFYDEDVPMLTPEQTMTREPTPFMISYQ